MDESRRLQQWGYAVVTVHTGEEAVSRAVEEPSIELVLMDIDLGEGIDGTEAAREILARRELPIIFLTSHAEREMVERVRNITRYGYLLKDSGDFVLNSSIEMAFQLYEAHREVAEKEQRMAEAERIAHLGSWEMELPDGTCYWSDEFFRICGYAPGAFEPTMECGLQLIHPDDRERAAQAVQHSIATGEPYHIEKRIVRPDGSVRHVQSRGEVKYDSRGKPERLLGFFLDVSQRYDV
jgi:PAS domain S-box-containing protein